MAIVPGAVAEFDVRLPAVVTEKFYQSGPSIARLRVPAAVTPCRVAAALQRPQDERHLRPLQHCERECLADALDLLHESLGTTSATRRSICSASSKAGLSRITSPPA